MDVPTDWTPGAAALGVAAAIGVLVALRIRARTAPAASAPPGRADELARQRDALYDQIRALDADTGWRPEDRALARHRLVLEAAETLRAIDAADAPAAAPVSPPPPRAGSPWVNAVIGLSAGVFGAALVLGIQSYTKPKETAAPMGQSNAPMAAAGPSPAATQRVALRKAAVDAHPDDLAARLAYARALIDADDAKGAFDQTQKITDAQPDNPDARTLQAVILLQIGDVDMATGLLDKVLAGHPDHVEALGYRGAIYLNAGKKDEAIAAWQKVIELDPSQKEAVEPLIEMARTGRNPFGAAPVTGGASGSASAMGGGGAAEAGPTPSDITGTITYSGAAPNVFIYLRPAGVDRGPPSAVKKLQNPTFPLEFRIGPGDSPMGGPFPEDGTLTVRVDLDGNPTTHEDGAPEVRVEHVKPGQTGVQVGL